MSDAFQIELPIALAVKVEHAMSERNCSLEEAIFFLVDEVSTPSGEVAARSSANSFLP